MIGRVAEFAAACGRGLNAVRPKRTFGPAEVDPYFGYATENEIVLRGRIISRRSKKISKPSKEPPSTWSNFKSMVALFNTRELDNVHIRCEGEETYTDEEGYFDLKLPRPNNASGWESFDCYFDNEEPPAQLTALLPSSDARYGVISDIDDTLIKTEAWSLIRNLWNSLTGNAESRLVFSDAVILIRKLHDNINPVFYVSSSPWNLHAFLNEVFERAGLTQGPKFLRDLGISKTKRVRDSHGNHKGRSIDTVLMANPALTFILIGDTGQHDAQVYHDAILRHPDRIRQVILRTPQASLDRSDTLWINKIMETGTPIYIGETYGPFLSA